MIAVLPLGVALPFGLALLPAALPKGASLRRLASVGAFSAAITLLVAVCCSIGVGPGWLNGPIGWWRDDRLARTMVMLPALAWMLVSLRALTPGEAFRSVPGRWRRWPVAAQLATACVMALCRADLLAVFPPLVGILLFLAFRDDHTDREGAVLFSAVPLMAAGVLLASAAIGAPARWSMPVAVSLTGRTTTNGLALLLLPLLLLSVFATVRPALAGRTGVLRGLPGILVSMTALLAALRCCAAAKLGALVLVFGIGAIGVSLLLLPACRRLPARLALAAAFQNGVVLLAVAVGGTGGVAAALILAGCQSLLLPVALCYPLDAASAHLKRLLIAVMVGLPPFGPFAAGLVLLVRLSGTASMLAIALLASAGLSAVSVLDASVRETVPASAARLSGWFGCMFLVLFLVLWIGLAMPASVSDWLLSIGGARS